MWRLVSRSVGAALVSALLLSTAVAQQPAQQLSWAEKMFSDLTIDFGTIARGAEVSHYVTIENLYKEDVTLSSVGTSCKCAIAKADKLKLKTHEKATVEVHMDTRTFMGRKNSNLDVTVTFDGVHFKSVRVPITAFIRSDIVVNPERTGFGTVMWGAGAERLVDVTYAGRADWKIQQVRAAGQYVTVETKETARGAGQVKYQLLLRLLPSAPVGTLLDRITLVTDDRDNPEFPITVEAVVEPDIVAAPEVVKFGSVTPGSEKMVPVVLKSLRPFEIERIECASDLNCFKMKDSPGAKTVHVIPLTIVAPEKPGEYTEVFSVTIPGRPEPFEFEARFQVGG